MEIEEFEILEELGERCGEVFLSIKGDLVFLCTLCEFQIKEYQGYLNHLSKMHYTQEEGFEFDEDTNQRNDLLDMQDITVEEVESNVEEMPDTHLIHANNIDKLEIDEKLEETDFILVEQEITQENDLVDLEIISDIKEETDIPQKQTILQQNTTKEISKSKPRSKPNQNLIKKREKLPLDSAERKHKCPQCGFGFRDISNLHAHIRRHSDEQKKFSCSHCAKRFHSNTELISHERRHTKERPYLCTDCGQTFVTSSSLTNHTKRHLNIRNSVCSICNKSFYDNSLLKEHMITHNTDNRVFKCDECGAAFPRRKALLCHKKLHENKREYKCDLCSASFNQGPGLYSHLRSRHELSKTTINNYRKTGVLQEEI